MSQTSPERIKLEKLMIKAAKNGSVDAVSSLLAMDPSLIDSRDSDGSSPLHCAAWKGQLEVARALLDAGANIEDQNTNEHWGGTPLHAAAHGNQKLIAELLIARGANVNAVSCNGRKPLTETTFHNATAVAKLLRLHGAEE